MLANYSPAIAPPPAPHLGIAFQCPHCRTESLDPTDFATGYCPVCAGITGPPGWSIVRGACELAGMLYDNFKFEHVSRPAFIERSWRQWVPEARAVLNELYASNHAHFAYIDLSRPERHCDFCLARYRGPAVYCCLECAVADA